EISQAAGKAVPGIIDEESNGNNAQIFFIVSFHRINEISRDVLKGGQIDNLLNQQATDAEIINGTCAGRGHSGHLQELPRFKSDRITALRGGDERGGITLARELFANNMGWRPENRSSPMLHRSLGNSKSYIIILDLFLNVYEYSLRVKLKAKVACCSQLR
ncbi:hypothetical protein STEG23_005440, partial [Scotinomys teguina]